VATANASPQVEFPVDEEQRRLIVGAIESVRIGRPFMVSHGLRTVFDTLRWDA